MGGEVADGMAPTPVSEIMSKDVVTVRPSLPLPDLICLLIDRSVGGAPVVDALGHPVGMVSKSDLVWEDHDWAEAIRGMASWRKLGGRAVEGDDGLETERNLAALTVGDVMTLGALSVLPTASVVEAARLMMSNRVHRLSVVDASRKLVGIVTTYDVTRWVAEAAEGAP